MFHSIVKFAGTSMLYLTLGSLTACGNVSRDVARDGHAAGQLIWPAPESASPMHRGGTFPNLDNLRQVRAGLNKQQIANLIGYPHFSEGAIAVREWNYLFNFRQPDSDRATVCQYKILFDDNRVAQSFYWAPTSCSQLSTPPVAIAASSSESPEEQVITLSTDALFAFDKSSVDDITDNGKAQLGDLARKLIAAGGGVRHVQIAGYTDRLGSEAYNSELSERRAYAVMHYLVNRGVPEDSIVAEGRGMESPFKDCPESPRALLIACLAPNRRVDVKVDMVGDGRVERKRGR
jgi:Outer membrane protein and related peptidoglycan-associated (lipo)proteins